MFKNYLVSSIILPVGITISTFKGDPHSLEMDLPAGYFFVGYERTTVNCASVAEPFSAPVTKVTCACTHSFQYHGRSSCS
jgi:hypothetical protein